MTETVALRKIMSRRKPKSTTDHEREERRENDNFEVQNLCYQINHNIYLEP